MKQLIKIYVRSEKLLVNCLKIKYRNNNIGGFDENNNQRIVAIDQNLFTHDESGQVQVVDCADTSLKNIYLNIIRERNAENLSKTINCK